MYTIGANYNHGESLFKLGWCFAVGHGSERNTMEENRLYKLSYEAGSAKGASHYGFA